jgi:hypothetical protein
VVLNPVRAKRVQRPQEWIWSSYGGTGGRTKPHPCFETDWVLSQFGSKRKIAEAGYRRFVREGIGADSIWNSVRAQSVFGEGDFIESLRDYVGARKQIPEIAKSQRFMNRPPLRDIFRSEVLRDKRKRDKGIGEAVFEHGYTQREVADHLGIHFTSVSRMLRAKDKMQTK